MPKKERRHPRLNLPVYLEVKKADSGIRKGYGFITNLSLGGLSLKSTQDFNLGEKFIFRFTVSEGVDFDFLGEIIWVRKGDVVKTYGVKFKESDPFKRLKLSDYILVRFQEEKRKI